MKDFLLTFLGSDSGFGEKNNSAYIEIGNELLLIDCGYTVFDEARKRLDLKKYEKVNIIITHLHNDHAGSLSQFILYSFFVFGKKVNVYSKCERIKEYLDIIGAPEMAYNLSDDLPNGKFIKTKHVPTIDTYGFCLSVNGKKIVYTSDTTTLEPYMEYLDGADELYVDVSYDNEVHLKIEECIETLRKIKEQGVKVILMHLDNRQEIERIVNGEFYYA